MKGIDIDEMAFGMPDDTGAGDDLGGIGGEGVGTDGADGAAGMDDDPMSVLRRNPTVRNMVTVTFTRDAFLKRLDTAGLDNPEETYRMFGAVMDVDGEGGLKPISADFDLADSRFSPTGSQEEPELADRQFSPATAHVLGAQNSAGLAIQRVDLLQHGVNEFHDIARNTSLGSVEKAQRAMQVIESICDPELTGLASQVTSALIDGKDTPDFTFTLADDLDKERLRARDMLFSGQADPGHRSGRSGRGPFGPGVCGRPWRTSILQLLCRARGLQPAVRHIGRAYGAYPGQSVLRAHGAG